MDAVGVIPFSQLEYPEIVHSVLKHKFCIFSHVEGLQNAPKYSLKSFSVQWSRMAAFGAKPFSQLEYPRNSAFGPETQALHPFTRGRFTKCSKPFVNIIFRLME
jgi:hypothetical protein